MFTNFRTVGAIKSEYRKLAKANHPDLGGNTQTMQKINELYHNALEGVNGQTRVDNGKTYTYKYNAKVEQKVMDKVMEILSKNIPNIEVEIIGLWIWVTGTEYSQRKLFNTDGLKMKWHGKKKAWTWKPYRGRTHYSGKNLGQLRQQYGNRRFDGQSETALAN